MGEASFATILAGGVTLSGGGGAGQTVIQGISKIEADGLNLIFTTDSGDKVTVTFPEPKAGASVSGVEINANNHLVVTLSDGTEVDAGEMPTATERKPVEFEIKTASDTWSLQHNLNDQHPTILCFDGDGDTIFGSIEYYSQNLSVVHFDIPVKGKAIVR